ncbi:hypothetical protein Nmel_010181 [Mimus melanotis]
MTTATDKEVSSVQAMQMPVQSLEDKQVGAGGHLQPLWAHCGSVAGGIMKSCSFRSFCERARRDGSRAPGVSVHCCYSNNCNAKSLAPRVTSSSSYCSLLIFTLLWHPLLKLT